MKADLQISVKDFRRNKNLKIQLLRVPFSSNRQFWVKMNGVPWPSDGRPVCLTRSGIWFQAQAVAGRAPVSGRL
jgi:hypothetical protein